MIITSPVWTVITGSLLPILIAAVTHVGASKRFKAIVGILVAAVGALVARATLADGSALFTSALVVDIAVVYGTQVLTYLGFWRPNELNAKVIPDVGIG